MPAVSVIDAKPAMKNLTRRPTLITTLNLHGHGTRTDLALASIPRPQPQPLKAKISAVHGQIGTVSGHITDNPRSNRLPTILRRVRFVLLRADPPGITLLPLVLLGFVLLRSCRGRRREHVLCMRRATRPGIRRYGHWWAPSLPFVAASIRR